MARRAERSAPSGTRVVERAHPEFPRELFDLDDPPDRVFVRGPWPLPAPRVAIVGSRAATPYGLSIAARLGSDLAALGIPVVSGLAHGIDAAAHRGALDSGGTTVAVLPGPLDRVVPAAHGALASEIERGGALLSECGPGQAVYKASFLERNRLIAALALVVVVVEAAERSGALSTAGHARRLGRRLLAVPGDVDRPTSRGTHALLRTGAQLCEGVADVCTALDAEGCGVAPGRNASKPPGAGDPVPGAAYAGGDEAPPAALLALIETHAVSAEEVARATGRPLEEILGSLLRLEWAGLVRCEPGGRWARRGVGR